MTNLPIILYTILCIINLILLILWIYSKLLKQYIDDNIIEEDRESTYALTFSGY